LLRYLAADCSKNAAILSREIREGKSKHLGVFDAAALEHTKICLECIEEATKTVKRKRKIKFLIAAFEAAMEHLKATAFIRDDQGYPLDIPANKKALSLFNALYKISERLDDKIRLLS
jgi:hypothetical protein